MGILNVTPILSPTAAAMRAWRPRSGAQLAWRRRVRPSSTWAASRPGPARSPSMRPRRSRASCPSSRRIAAALGYRRSPSTPASPRSWRRRSRPGPASSMMCTRCERRARALGRRKRRWASASCTCRANPAPCSTIPVIMMWWPRCRLSCSHERDAVHPQRRRPRRDHPRSGPGFGKSLEHNLTLLKSLSHFAALNSPLLVGVSRKSFIGRVLGRPVEDRLYGGLGLAALSVSLGARIIRTHDVGATRDAIGMVSAVLQGIEH